LAFVGAIAVLALPVLALPVTSVGAAVPAPPAPVPCAGCWAPRLRTSWDWVLSTVPQAPYRSVAMYDIDGFDASTADVAAMHAAGIKVVSFDSDVTCPNHLFINQANTEQIGTSEVDLLAKAIGSKGEIAILSAAASATNQNAWIGYMKQQLKKYPNMKLVSTVYGNDDPATSLTVLQGLLSAYPNLRGIISPTTVGISTAAQYLSTHKSLLSTLTLTGLGLPSQMKSYVHDGTVKQFELWNPDNLGYLAGYAAAGLASGSASLKADSKFDAGKLGSYTVLAPSATTGPSVVLGPPTVFDSSNVDQFNF